MEIYDKDPILQLKRELMKEINDDDIIDENATFEEIISRYPKINNKVLLIKGDEKKNKLFNMIKDQPFIKIKKMYFSKDSLIDDKKLSSEEVERKGRKRDSLISQLFKIQKLIKLYDYKKYNEFIKIIDYPIYRIEDKRLINEKINKLKETQKDTIEKMINLADQLEIVKKDDNFNLFIENNEYLYNRVKELPYSEFENLFNYIEGYTPFSTQHKVKGAEFDNVLVILDNGRWNQYNFENLFTLAGNENVLKRTQKIFYVCCTRAKEKLYVYYCQPSREVIIKAIDWFGKDNIVKI